MLNFDFLEKGLFVYDFSRKMFIIYILLTDQVLLSDCLYFFRYWEICVLQLFVSQVDVIDFETNLIFLIKSFFYMTKKSRRKFKYHENKK